MVPFLALALFIRQDSPEALLKRMQDAVKAGDQPQVTSLFENKSDSDYLFRMASRSGGLKGLKVAVFPAPQGWESTGKYWAMFHTWQELEQDHDPVYRVVETPQGLELGSEIPEWDCGGQISQVEAAVHIMPETGSCEIEADEIVSRQLGKAIIFRLNDLFNDIKGRSRGPVIFGYLSYDENKVTELNPNASYRIGSLIIEASPSRGDTVGHHIFMYRGTIGQGAQYSSDRDQITKDHAYLTSFWLPSLGRLPFKTKLHIYAPADWVVRSEGEPISDKGSFGFTTGTPRSYECDVPIAYPKVCAGKYELALEENDNGHILRSYQFAPSDAKRAALDMGWMKKAMAFYESNLGPFPFKEYDCFDGKDYYGIESYSYTILDPKITTWAVSHEMGHTYFGGLVPCAYVKDSWNEGMTQYVDDVLLHHNPEVADLAMRGIGVHVPLTQMPVAWEYQGATYWRGAFAMQMLDAEIGHDKVLAGLRALIKDRVGKDTTWPDLRQYFEQSSGQDLKWFWDQWISGAVFPHVSITSAATRQEAGKWITRVTVKQDGTLSPFRLRFAVRVASDTPTDLPVLMTEPQQTYEVTTDFQPKQASINQGTTALVTVDAPVPVTPGS